MSIAWSSLLLVCVVSLVVGVVVVALVSFALVGLSARERPRVGGPDDGAPTISPAVGTAVAGLALAVVVAIVAYGLYTIAA